MVRSLRRESDHLQRCTKSLAFSSKILWCHQKKGSSFAHCVPLFKKNRCKSVLALKRSITKDEAVEVVSVKHDHEAKPRAGSLLQCSQSAWTNGESSDQLWLTRPLFSYRRTDLADFHRPRFCMDSNVRRFSALSFEAPGVAALMCHHIHLQACGGSTEQQQVLCVVQVEQRLCPVVVVAEAFRTLAPSMDIVLSRD